MRATTRGADSPASLASARGITTNRGEPMRTDALRCLVAALFLWVIQPPRLEAG